MRKRRVYIETTIPSFLVARTSRDIVKAARQQMTHDWWDQKRSLVNLFTSQFVVDEAAQGDPEVAAKRLAMLDEIPILEPNAAVSDLADALMERGAIPRKANTDALHVAIATVFEMDILLTWNCEHLANAILLGNINRIIRSTGREPPVICTPEEMLGE